MISLTNDERFALEARDNGLSLEFRLKEAGIPAETEISISEVIAAIRSAGIKTEIDETALVQVLETRSEGWVEVSRGIQATSPTDGWLEFLVGPFHQNSPDKENEEEIEESRVDFKQLNLISNVTVGQEIVRKHDAIPGKEGTDIFGKSIAPPPPSEVQLKTGPGIGVIEDGHLAIATEDGAVTRKDDQVSITHTYEVSGDVSYKTGNIEFNGSVSISGNVLAGFSVVAEDDILVGGLVEGAEIKAGGGIRIVGGIQGGGKAHLEAGESIVARFASDATLVAGDQVTVEKHLLNCKVRASSTVFVGDDQGTISGGEVLAGETIHAAILGSEIGAKTVLSLGLTPDLVKETATRKDELKDLSLRLNDIEQVIERISTLPEFSSMSPSQVETIRVKSVQQKFLLQGRIQQLQEEIPKLEEELRLARGGSITATDRAHGGTTIKISGDALRLDHDLRHTTFCYEDGEIRTKTN